MCSVDWVADILKVMTPHVVWSHNVSMLIVNQIISLLT